MRGEIEAVVCHRPGEHLDSRLISQMVDGEVSREDFLEALRHLASCEFCRKEAEAVWRVASFIEAFADEFERQARQPPDHVYSLEEEIFSRLAGVVVVPWWGSIPGARSFRAKARSLVLSLKDKTRDVVALKPVKIVRAIEAARLTGKKANLTLRFVRKWGEVAGRLTRRAVRV